MTRMSVIMIVEKRKMKLTWDRNEKRNSSAGYYHQKKFGENAHPMASAADVLYLLLTVDNKTSPSTRISMCEFHAENKHDWL